MSPLPRPRFGDLGVAAERKAELEGPDFFAAAATYPPGYLQGRRALTPAAANPITCRWCGAPGDLQLHNGGWACPAHHENGFLVNRGGA